MKNRFPKKETYVEDKAELKHEAYESRRVFYTIFTGSDFPLS